MINIPTEWQDWLNENRTDWIENGLYGLEHIHEEISDDILYSMATEAEDNVELNDRLDSFLPDWWDADTIAATAYLAYGIINDKVPCAPGDHLQLW